MKVSVANSVIVGFDSAGEPELRLGDKGALEIVFNFMPPLNETGDPNPHPVFDTFEVVLTKALGVEVVRDDRELFVIPKPQSDTMAKTKVFLETFWAVTWPKLSTGSP
jgi:hypothetical protein